MRALSCIAILVSIITLCACSKSPTSPSQAKMSACSNDPYLMKYNCSVSRVQQLASQGDPDAQYALGYMYYYGVSTVRDEDNARLWISRSAAQGQPLAKKAMVMLSEDKASIRHNDSLIKSTIAEVNDLTKAKKPTITRHQHRLVRQRVHSQPKPVTLATKKPVPVTVKHVEPKAVKSKPITVAVNKSVAATVAMPAVQKEKTEVLAFKRKQTQKKSTKKKQVKKPSKNNTNKEKRRQRAGIPNATIVSMEDDLMHLPSQGYVLQLMGNHHLGVIEDFVKRHHLSGKVKYYSANFHHGVWYMLVYGQYKNVSEAHAAITTLPKDLKHMQPWIKPIRAVKAEIKTRNLVS